MRGKPSEPITPAMPVLLGQGERSVEDAVSYSVTHRVRIEIRAILNEGTRSQDELAKLVRPPVGSIGYHLRELLADGSIALAYVKQVRNANKYFYRAVEMPFYTDEEIAAMPPVARQAVIGVALQAIMAEALAAFWAGKMIDDGRLWMAWRWFNVDQRGRGDIADEQARSWERVREIEAESTNRCARSGEPTKSIIVSSLGYVRCRFSADPPMTERLKDETVPETPIRLGQGMRCVENAISYAVSHRVRAEILAILNEAARSREELAYLIGEPPEKIKHHIKALLDEGSIEIAYTEQVGNMNQYFYRAVEMPFYTDEEIAAMPPVARQAVIGVALQAIMAEALAAFWAGKMIDDGRLWMAWRWFNVDQRGRGDIADEQARSWERVREIEAESTNRCARSGEPTKSIIVSSLGYVRCRSVPSSTPGAGPNRPSAVGNVLGPQGRPQAVRP